MKTSQLAFYTEDGKWLTEKGKYEIMVGASSADLYLKEFSVLKKSRIVDGRTRGFYME